MLNKNDIRNRLKQAREALPGEVSPHSFAFSANGVDPSQYTKYEKGEGPLGPKKIMELCSRWNIDTDWLQTGKGQMFGIADPAGETKKNPT